MHEGEPKLNELGRKTSEEVKEAFSKSGVDGLSGLGLSDSDVVRALRRHCVQPPLVPKVLHESGWNSGRFANALKDMGLEELAIEKLRLEFEELA